MYEKTSGDSEPKHHNPENRQLNGSQENQYHSSGTSHNAPFYRWDSTIENKAITLTTRSASEIALELVGRLHHFTSARQLESSAWICSVRR